MGVMVVRVLVLMLMFLCDATYTDTHNTRVQAQTHRLTCRGNQKQSITADRMQRAHKPCMHARIMTKGQRARALKFRGGRRAGGKDAQKRRKHWAS